MYMYAFAIVVVCYCLEDCEKKFGACFWSPSSSSYEWRKNISLSYFWRGKKRRNEWVSIIYPAYPPLPPHPLKHWCVFWCVSRLWAFFFSWLSFFSLLRNNSTFITYFPFVVVVFVVPLALFYLYFRQYFLVYLFCHFSFFSSAFFYSRFLLLSVFFFVASKSRNIMLFRIRHL